MAVSAYDAELRRHDCIGKGMLLYALHNVSYAFG
jgi:hypothetical protein